MTSRSVARRAAFLLYARARPILRPIAWRLRGFLLADLSGRVEQLNANVSALTVRLAASVEALSRTSAAPEPVADAPPPPAPAPPQEAPPAPVPPQEAEPPLRSSIEELDALNERYADRPMRERINAVSAFLLEVDKGPMAQAGDPFDQDYHDRVVKFWAQLSGRVDYDPRRDELSPYVAPASSLLSPSFYASGDSRHAGEFLLAIGFILQQLDLKRGDSLLEYGAGEGQIAMHAVRLGCDVSVIDVEQRYLDCITLQARSFGAEIAVQQGVFGDAFGDGKTFDRILFFEAFHHALDHARVLRRLHDHLKPGGRVVFAGEPMIERGGPWTHVVPYPWGPRLDGLSINAMRIHGWCELGFRTDYFIEALLRSGYLCTFEPCALTAAGNCYVARQHGGRIAMGDPFLIQASERDCGWHAPANGSRFTGERAKWPLDRVAARNGLAVDFSNDLPVEQVVAFRFASVDHTLRLAAGERREAWFEVPENAAWLDITCSPATSGATGLQCGIAVHAIIYGAGEDAKGAGPGPEVQPGSANL